jgi:Asp/Glu/hydantoin racemase
VLSIKYYRGEYMGKKIAILHTTIVTVPLLKKISKEILPDVDIYNFVDDSILPQLLEGKHNQDFVFEKLLQYSNFAQKQGVDLILCACSSVGEFVEYANDEFDIPVVRIDEAMAENAVKMGRKIYVMATLQTTLEPSYRLIKNKVVNNKHVLIESILLKEAYMLLQQEKVKEHDRYIAERLVDIVQDESVVVLAQASMSNALAYVPAKFHSRILASTVSGMRRVAEILRI